MRARLPATTLDDRVTAAACVGRAARGWPRAWRRTPGAEILMRRCTPAASPARPPTRAAAPPARTAARCAPAVSAETAASLET
eukprot:scaffold1681_cov105-Isochrysis_galbana.AAC.7